MQTLAYELRTTLVDEIIELVKGFGRTLVHLATAPIERIANACDVAGMLERRRAEPRAPRGRRQGGRRCDPRNCPLSPFGSLSELT
jgi:hypothetical protein